MSILAQTGEKPSPERLWSEISDDVGEGALLSLLLIAMGLGCSRSVGLAWPPLEGWGQGPDSRRRMWSAVNPAMISGAVALGLDLVFGYLVNWGGDDIKIAPPPWWAALLASVGAGIREEIWLRLGIMTFFVWVGVKLTRLRSRAAPEILSDKELAPTAEKLATQPSAAPVVIWIGNLLACLVFGALHLPQAAHLTGHLSGQMVAFALVGNGVPGLIFGRLYWRKGLIAAIVSHATTDVLLKVTLPLLGFGIT